VLYESLHHACTGSLLGQLLRSSSLRWDPDLLQQLLTAIVTECRDRTVGLDVLLPIVKEAAEDAWSCSQESHKPASSAASAAHCPKSPQDQSCGSPERGSGRSSSSSRRHKTGASGLGKSQQGPRSSLAANGSLQYQLHWSSAITANILEELVSSSPNLQGAEVYNTADADAGGIAAAGRTTTLGDFLPGSSSLTPTSRGRRSRAAFQQQQRRASLANLQAKVLDEADQDQQEPVQREVCTSAEAAAASALSGRCDSDGIPSNNSAEVSCDGGELSSSSSLSKLTDALRNQAQLSLPCTLCFSSLFGGRMPGPLPQEGDLVVLTKEAMDRNQAAQDQGPVSSIEGRVVGSSEFEILVEVPWQPVMVNKGFWRVDVLGNLTTYERMMSGLCQVAKQVQSSTGRVDGRASGGSYVLQQLLVSSWVHSVQGGSCRQSSCDVGASHPLSANSHQQQSGGEERAVGDIMQQLRVAATEDVVKQDEQLLQATCGELQHLNNSQLGVVRTAASQRLALIWGPPGTGKVSIGRKRAHL
jgi:hypothetical protein